MKKTRASLSLVFFMGILVGLLVRPYVPQSLPFAYTAAPTLFPTKSVMSPSTEVHDAASQYAKVVEVVDGDTVVLDTGETVRYVGIDTPETKHPRLGVQCFGKTASEKNADLVLGKSVRLEKDTSETDKYNRLLRFLYIPTEQGELFVNDYLVREGYAKAVTYPPDVKYADRFKEAQREAKANNRGLWGEC